VYCLTLHQSGLALVITIEDR